MPHKKVTIEWRRGVLGDGGTFTFSPNPFLQRSTPGKRTATLTVPLLDGVVIQNLGVNERTIELRGVLFNKTNTWDDMENQRNALVEGLETGPGQLHIISPSKNIFYNAQIDTAGIQFDEQQFSNIQDYTIVLRIPDSDKITRTTQTIISDARIT